MHAFIYAAGRGIRLQGKLGDQPKILLEFGGRTLLDWHCERLVAVGCEEVMVVTGYQHPAVGATLPALAARHGLRVRSRLNPDFTEGSVLSLAVTLPELEATREPVLLMDGDVLYPAEMLRRLWASPHRTALLMDRDYSTADDDPVLVPVRAGRPFDFRKQWTGTADQVGESIGFFKLDPADVPALAAATRRRLTGPGRLDSYDEVLRELVMAGHFGCEDVTGLPWTELDFPEDVARAERAVLPAILRLPA